MITGAHAILYSTDADADRAFFRAYEKFNSTKSPGRSALTAFTIFGRWR